MSTSTPASHEGHHRKQHPPRAKGKPRRAGRTPTPDRWDAWCKHLVDRKKPAGIGQILYTDKRSSPLEWATHDPLDEATRLRIAMVQKLVRKGKADGAQLAAQVEDWLQEAGHRKAEQSFALECLAWTHALPQLTTLLPSAPWSQLLDQLVQIAREAASHAPEQSALSAQLLAGELPITLAYQFPELPAARPLFKQGKKTISNGAVELLDGQGMPASRRLSMTRCLLACWTRCLLLGRAGDSRVMSEKAQAQFSWLTRESLRLSRFDGSQVLDDLDRSAARWNPFLLSACLQVAGDRGNSRLADALLGKRKIRAKTRGPARFKLPEPAVMSEWAEVAVLRTDWHPRSPQLAVTFSESRVRCELNYERQTLISGDWTPELSVDGQRFAPTSEWEEVCWCTDDDVDYLELQADYGDRHYVQRQFLLAREDRFLIVADAVVGQLPARLNLRSACPLAPGVEWNPDSDTRDGFVVADKLKSLVMPLSLGEWRIGPPIGTFQQSERRLILDQDAEGSAMYAAWFFDLDPQRRKCSSFRTWRQLTVAADLDRVSPQEAFGCRIQVGGQQWVLYRSLTAPVNRTLIGQNLSSEFVIGRFDCEGTLEPLIEVE